MKEWVGVKKYIFLKVLRFSELQKSEFYEFGKLSQFSQNFLYLNMQIRNTLNIPSSQPVNGEYYVITM